MTIYSALQKLNIANQSVSRELLHIKERSHKSTLENMNLDEYAAIYLYTTAKMPNNRPLYTCLNEALRENDKNIIKIYFYFLKLLITALLKLVPVKQVVLRCIQADLSKRYPVGKTFVWSGFR